MKKTAIMMILGLMMAFVFFPSVNASDSGIITDQQVVTISFTSKGLQVIESIKMTNTNSEENVTTLRFWIQQNAQDTKILDISSGTNLIAEISGNIRICSLDAVNITFEPGSTRTIEVTYFLPTTEQNYIKTLLYDTTSFTVIYKEGNNRYTLFQGANLLYESAVNNALQIRIYQPTEAPLSILMIVIVFIVVLIILASLLLLFRKHRRRAKKTIIESEETLITKKTLLVSLLKDLEKQYRAQSISTDTYSKIKEEYKQQTVDVMKKLDDLKK